MKCLRDRLSPRSTAFLCIAAIFILAAAIRLLYLYEIVDNPFFNHMMIDEDAYDTWAQRIAAGEWIGKQVFYQDPLYPYFLAVLYSLIGRDLLWIRVIQLLIGSVTCVFIYMLGTRLFDRRTGMVAGVIAAMYRPFFYFETLFLKSFLGVFLICALMLMLIVARSKRSFFLWVGTGLMFGILALVRANTMVLMGGVAVWLLVTREKEETLKHQFIAFSGLLIGLAIVLSLVGARNYIVGQDMVLLTSQAGQNFYIGNNPANKSGRYEPPLTIRPNPRYEQEDFHVQAEIALGRKLKPSEASAYWFGRAFDFIREKPLDWCKLMWIKFRMFWNWYEVPDNQNYYFFRRYSRLLQLPLPDFRSVAALALAGMILCLPRWKKTFLLYLVVILYSGTVIAFYIFDRYRLPVVPPLIVFAAYVVTSAEEMVARKRYVKFGATAVSICIFLLLLSTHVKPIDYTFDRANAYCRLGAVQLAEGKLDDAQATYTRAASIVPIYWAAYYGLAEVQERKHEWDHALKSYGAAKKFNPGNIDIYIHRGRIFYSQGKLEESAEEFRGALRLAPNRPDLHRWLATIYHDQGDETRAEAQLRKFRELTLSEE